jgi:protein-tyrosine-phosphatase/DNA-binding transcriptional ArsR family regulator
MYFTLVGSSARAGEPLPPVLFQLAGDPLRWRLLSELARSDRRVRELNGSLGEPQSLVSYHLRRLRAAKLVSKRRSSADGRDAYYTLDLGRCDELLADAGAALHPGLRSSATGLERPRRHARPTRVLFLCTGNSARSQVAEALLQQLSDGTVEAFSAGSEPKSLDPNAVHVLRERGIDSSDRKAKHLGTFSRWRFDYVISLCDRVREVCTEFPGTPQTIHWSVRDPAREPGTDEQTLPAFERTAAELATRIGFLLEAIKHNNSSQEVTEHA